MTRRAALRPGTCRHCDQPVTWATFPNGRNRSFDTQAAADVAPGDRYAYNRRTRTLVCLDGEQVTVDPVLTPHLCRQYVEALAAARALRTLGELADDLPFLIRRT